MGAASIGRSTIASRSSSTSGAVRGGLAATAARMLGMVLRMLGLAAPATAVVAMRCGQAYVYVASHGASSIVVVIVRLGMV